MRSADLFHQRAVQTKPLFNGSSFFAFFWKGLTFQSTNDINKMIEGVNVFLHLCRWEESPQFFLYHLLMITQAGSSAAFLYRKEKVIDKRCRTSNKQTGSYGGKDEKEQNQTNWEMIRFSSACTRSHHFCIFCSCLCAGSGSCNFTGSDRRE